VALDPNSNLPNKPYLAAFIASIYLGEAKLRQMAKGIEPISKKSLICWGLKVFEKHETE
jgi:hypothetical protein